MLQCCLVQESVFPNSRCLSQTGLLQELTAQW